MKPFLLVGFHFSRFLVLNSCTDTILGTFPDITDVHMQFILPGGQLLANFWALYSWKPLDEVDNSTGSAIA